MAVIAAPSFRVCTPDQIQRTKLRSAYKPSAEPATPSSIANLIGWLAGGIGIGVLALLGIVATHGSDPTSATVATDMASQVSAATIIEIGPTAAESAGSPGTDFEIPDEPQPRAVANVAKPAKRRAGLDRRSP